MASLIVYMLLLLWRACSETSALNEVVQPKRVFDGFPQLVLPRKVVRYEYDKSSWLGEIMRRP